jgi:hypothetical protein
VAASSDRPRIQDVRLHRREPTLDRLSKAEATAKALDANVATLRTLVANTAHGLECCERLIAELSRLR